MGAFVERPCSLEGSKDESKVLVCSNIDHQLAGDSPDYLPIVKQKSGQARIA